MTTVHTERKRIYGHFLQTQTNQRTTYVGLEDVNIEQCVSSPLTSLFLFTLEITVNRERVREKLQHPEATALFLLADLSVNCKSRDNVC